MTTPVQVPLNLDGSQYLSMSQQIIASNQQMMSSMSGLGQAGATVQRAYGQLAPSNDHITRMSRFADAAASSRQELSQLYAAQAAGGGNAAKLTQGIQQLSQQLPIGQRNAAAIVETISQLGLGSQGSEKRVTSLAKTVGQLQEAVGGSGPDLGAGLVQLERTFGDQGVDPKRVQATADSLTTVSHELGASASGVLQFTNLIGPFAQAAGIGKTASLGIAASFSRIGQDGSYAANTVGTLLQGINVAVQEGSPDLAKYANIVGTTAGHFQALFKSDPAGTLTKITQALAQTGPQTTMQLQGLGLDSVRSQRALQALIQSGGLQQGISTAVGAYGNGSTGRAANAGFNNVEDNFTRAGSAALNLAQNLGTPLLAPLNLFAKTVAGVTGGISSAVGGVLHTRVGGDIANTALMLGGTALLARRVSRPLGMLGLGGAVAGSQTSRSLLAGYTTARYGGDVEAAQASRLGRLATFGMRPGTTSPFDRYADRNDQRYFGQNWRGETVLRGGAAQQGWLLGAGAGGARFGMSGMPTTGGPGILSRAGSMMAAPFEAAQFAFRTQRDAATQARLSLRGRGPEMLEGEAASIPQGAYRTAGMRAQDAWRSYRQGGAAGDFTAELRNSFKGLSGEVTNTGKVFGPMRNALSAFGSVVVEQGRLMATMGSIGGGMAGRAAGGIGRGLLGAGGQVMGFLGGPVGLALTAGMGALQYSQMYKGDQAAARDAAKSYDIYGDINASREAAGQATLTATGTTGTSLAGTTAAGTTAAAGKPTGTDLSGMGYTVSDSDIATAQATRGKVAVNYGRGTATKDLISRINATYGGAGVGGMSPQDAQNVRIDLLRQGYSRSQVNNVMAGITRPSGGGARPPSTGTAFSQGNLNTIVAGGNIPVDVRMGPDKSTISWQESTGLDQPGFGIRGLKGGKRGVAQGDINAVRSSVDQLFQAQVQQYGQPFAQQQEMQGINQLFKGGNDKSQNAYFLSQMGRSFSDLLTGKQTRIGINDVDKYGGFVQALAAKNPDFAKQVQDLLGANGSLTPGQGLQPQIKLSPAGQQMADIGGPLATYYNNRTYFTTDQQKAGGTYMGPTSASDPAQRAARSATMTYLAPGNQGDVSKLQSAAEAQINAATKSGTSLASLAASAEKAANTINDTSSAAYQLNTVIGQMAQQRLTAQQPFQTTGQTFGAQSQLFTGEANTNINSPGGQQTRLAGQQGQQQLLGQAQNMMKQYLQAEQQYQIQSGRANEDHQKQISDATADFQRQQLYASQDYYRQLSYNQADYQRSTTRGEQDFRMQMGRAEADYRLSQTRAEQDFGTSMQRQQRDFQISMQRGQQDFLVSQGRAVRDFNKQLGREIEDSAQSLYDPYKRIQTQQIWDTKDLLTNLQQQNDAIKKQSGQLNQIRGMGISNQTIQQLGLNDPANAQQLSQMVNDLLNDPALVKQINQTAAARMSLGSILVTDPSNKDIARAKQDFATQMADMETDYRKSVARAQQDMARAVADEQADFGKQMLRMEQDFYIQMARANQDFGITMSRAAEDEAIALQRMDEAYNTSVQRANEQFATSMDRMNRDFNQAMARMRADVTLSESEIAGSMNDIATAVHKTMSGQQVNWQNLMHSGLNDVLTYLQRHKGDFATAYQNLVGGDIQSLFPKGGTGGPGPKGDPFASLFSTMNSKMSGEWPVADPTVTQEYGHNGHPGIDLAVGRGTPIHAALGGTVILAGWDDGYGNAVILDHGGGRSTLYGHQERVGVQVGERVTGGQTIGWVDSTGNSTGDHLHFETRQDGRTSNPRDTLPKWMATAGTGKQSPIYHGPYEFLINSAEALTLLAQQRAQTDTLDTPGLHSTPGIEKYRGLVSSIARQLGWANGVPYIMAQMAVEDAAGDPAAVNRWDSNWFKGTPSVGLMQVVGPTYQSWKPRPDTGPYLYGTSIDPRSNIYAGVNYAIHDYPNDPQHGMAHGHGYFQGGIADGPTRINGVFGEAAKEALIPLDTRGAQVMADAFRRALGPDDIRSMLVAGHSSPVTYHYETHTTDAGTHIEGPITVQANDPNEMLRQLEAKKTAARLTPTGRKS